MIAFLMENKTHLIEDNLEEMKKKKLKGEWILEEKKINGWM